MTGKTTGDRLPPRRRRRLRRARVRLRRLDPNRQLVLAMLALASGVVAGSGAILFREAIGLVQWAGLGVSQERIYDVAAVLPWWHLLLLLTGGGLAVGLFLRFVMPGRRPQGVAEVIEAGAFHGGRMPIRAGLATALASAVSIGTGASVGREGPVLHLGASLSSWIAGRTALGRSHRMTMLGCGVAAAIAASFNAPLAGVLFALEVVVGHYALSAFAPVVIAAVTGTVISHQYFGAFPAFIVPAREIVSFWEMPAFALLGVASAGAAILLLKSIELTTTLAGQMAGPVWIRPALGGLLVGLIALLYPHVLGVGYGATSDALREAFPLSLLLALVVAKTAATAICLGSGFAGGVFSPSLVIGAMLGGAFGIVATHLFPELSSGHGAYTLVGMGAVAGAVLGAPISTILIIFELTADYELLLAVMIAVVVASTITRAAWGRSFFHWQLAARGVDLAGGREARLLRESRVRQAMRADWDAIPPEADLAEVRRALARSANGVLFVSDPEGRLLGSIGLAEIGGAAVDTAREGLPTAADIARRDPPVLAEDDDLEDAFRRTGRIREPHLAVVGDRDSMVMTGLVHRHDIVSRYQRAVAQARAEERGEA